MDYASSFLGFLPTVRRSIGVTQLLNKLESYLPPAQVDRVRDDHAHRIGLVHELPDVGRARVAGVGGTTGTSYGWNAC